MTNSNSITFYTVILKELQGRTIATFGNFETKELAELEAENLNEEASNEPVATRKNLEFFSTKKTTIYPTYTH
jgi:hypothetical protein